MIVEVDIVLVVAGASGLRNDTTGHMRSTADWISFGAGNTPVIYEG